VELVPFQAPPERNFKQSSPSAFGGPHLLGKCGARAYAIRDAEAVTQLCAGALKSVRATLMKESIEKSTGRERFLDPLPDMPPVALFEQ
jgi:hypothetical protein